MEVGQCCGTCDATAQEHREAANEADLLSYLLFDGAFANELIALGRRDARRRHDEIVAFFRAQMEVPAPAEAVISHRR